MLARGSAAAALVAVSLLAGCAGRRPPTGPTVRGDDVGVFRGVLTGSDGETSRFELALFVDRPDRVHAEVSGPVGGPRLILDAGAGRLAVTDVAEGVAFVGAATADALRASLGVALTPDELVAALLDRTPPPSATTFAWVPGREGRWPRRLRVAVGGVAVDLELRRTRGLSPEAAEALGRGDPPPGLAVEPIETLGHRGRQGAMFRKRSAENDLARSGGLGRAAGPAAASG